MASSARPELCGTSCARVSSSLATESGPANSCGVLAQVHLSDEVERVGQDRKKAEQRLKRLAQVYVDGHVPDDEYRRQKKQLEEKLRSLVVPDADAAVTAGRFLEDLPALWEKADLGERRSILLTILDAVYVDTVEEKRISASTAWARR